MAIASIAKLNGIRFTQQEIADLMLAEDRSRRRALMRGNNALARQHDAEMGLLAELLS